MNLFNDQRSESGTLDLGPCASAQLGKCHIHSHNSATPCRSSHNSATLEPLTADMVAVQTIGFRKKVASLCCSVLLYFAFCWASGFAYSLGIIDHRSDTFLFQVDLMISFLFWLVSRSYLTSQHLGSDFPRLFCMRLASQSSAQRVSNRQKQRISYFLV